MSGTHLLPPERTLPADRRDQILRSVLSDEKSIRTSGRRVRWIAPIAVGVVAGLVAVGAIVLADRDAGAPSNPPPATQDSNLDLGPLSQAEIDAERTRCRSMNAFAFEGSEVLFARRIDGPHGPMPVIILSKAPDQGYGLFGDLFVDAVPPAPTAERPIRSLAASAPHRSSNPELPPSFYHLFDPLPFARSIYYETPDYLKAAGLYRVADSIDRVEVRLGSPGGPEPWRVATPHNGLVYWAAWVKRSDYERGTELTLEWRAFDANGDPIDPELMPDRPQTITVGDPGKQRSVFCGYAILVTR
jgi:hypothetical protein